MSELSPFHLAIPVRELTTTRAFYNSILGCNEGRSSERWVDMNFFGHQIVLHLDENKRMENAINPVDGHDVPIPHFGVVLPMDEWNKLADKLKQHEINFIIEPYIRFEGEVGEQATMFFLDPSGNALEFKAFKDNTQLFTKQQPCS